MRRRLTTALGFGLVMLGSIASKGIADEVVPPGLADRAWSIADAVVTHHLAAPTRQEMLLAGIRAVLEEAGAPTPPGLASRVSNVVTPEQFRPLLVDVWPRTIVDHPKPPRNPQQDAMRRERVEGPHGPGLETAFLEGLLSRVPGEAALTLAKDDKVNDSMQANLYVGVHIALGVDEESKLGTIENVLEGGPADRAGLKKDDQIDQIDGVSAAGLTIRELIDRLRGPIGTEVVVRVRRDKAAEPITARMTRGLLPRKTLKPFQPLPGSDQIGIIQVEQILGSTPQELRSMARKIEADGFKAIILDLRRTAGESPHPTVLLADAFLERGTIGKVRTANSEVIYHAEPDALFRDWPIAVLVDLPSSGAARWLAAALQDNGRARIFGDLPGRSPDIVTSIPLPGGEWVVRMSTGQLLRGDGRSLKAAFAAENPAEMPRIVAPVIARRYDPANPGGTFPLQVPVEDKMPISLARQHLERMLEKANRP